jgi:hypothetical protein
LWHELDLRAKINVLADRQDDDIYRKQPRRPSLIPGTRAALFHGERQVTKGIAAYIRDAAHTPAMKEYLIRRSKEATGRDKSWDNTTYESIDWRHYGESFKKIRTGDESRFPSIPTTYSPPNDALQLSTTEWMDDALPAIGCGGGIQHIC